MRNHPYRAVALASLFAAALVVSACGSAQNRPEVVDTFPAQGAEYPGTISEVRFTFDDPVTILNPVSVAVQSGGVTIPLVALQDPDDPHSLLVRPAPGEFWRVGTTTIQIVAGWEVNQEGQYRLDDYVLRFTMGTALPVYFGVPVPASVVQTEGPDFLPVTTIPTPGARRPMGLTCSTVGADQRTWVQLETDGGTGEALAWFNPGAAAMTPVALTHEAGGNLVARAEAIAVDPDGEFVYAAYRDTALQQVRLHKIAVATGMEVDNLLLSPAASPGTSPQGLSLSPDGAYVDIPCAATAGARLVAVDAMTFTELDLGADTGTDGLPLPLGAGPLDNSRTLALIAPRAASEAVLTTGNLVGLEVVDLPSIVSGNPTCILRTPDFRFVVEGLSGYADDEAFSYRRLTSLTAEEPVVIDDATGEGNGPAAAVLDMAWFTGSTRLVALLDNEAAIYLRFLPGGVDQEDIDDTTPTAAVDLSSIAPGATLVAIPPPSVPSDP